ncbi:PaaI family thioesterase [Photobacterium galatheae]|uniref:Acyl-coenzyme A thioesterase THEM4 n=1 Tax=Photobacterium galatheae TaxID=1654360 RepID=A0A066S0L3_9GAMM|nr:hotdog domain-containing protein [Photobacterium galatheae]KDM93497.1 thioesterase [Photobacterium galatheae]MCM0147080.1 PaaI family thioesterase [Photobacterium galatheae]
MKQGKYFQDQVPNNHCFGCGPDNRLGLQIKSYWIEEDKSACTFVPSSHHSAGPTQWLNGGIISTIIDCHCICTEIAKGYQQLNRDIGNGEPVWYATGKLEVSFFKPVRIDQAVELVAVIERVSENKMTLSCDVYSEHELCCQGKVIAVRVSNHWFEGSSKISS